MEVRKRLEGTQNRVVPRNGNQQNIQIKEEKQHQEKTQIQDEIRDREKHRATKACFDTNNFTTREEHNESKMTSSKQKEIHTDSLHDTEDVKIATKIGQQTVGAETVQYC